MTSDDIAESTTMTAADAQEADVLDDVFASDRTRGAVEPPPVAEPELKPEAPAEPELQPDKAEEQAKPPEGEPEQPQGRDPRTGRFVPVTELVAERKKYQERADNEARLRQEAERRADEYARRMEAIERRMEAANRQPPPQPPDPFADPEGAFQHQQQVVEHRLFETRVLLSQDAMRERRPDYDEAERVFAEAAQQDPSLAVRLYQHPNPAKFAYETGKRLMALSRIGADPDAYEKRIREEERNKVLGELKAGRGQGQQPPQRFPGTLADATQSGQQGAVLTDEAMMADVFGSNRRR